MNMANTAGPPMTPMVPDRTPAASAAGSNVLPTGFHSVALGFSGSGASAATLRVTMIRFRFGELG